MSSHAATHNLLASTTEPLPRNVIVGLENAKSADVSVNSHPARKKRVIVKPVHKASLATVICAYALIASIVLWLIFAFVGRGTSKESLFMERTCVDMTRHKVKPITPAIDSVRGGDQEPFAFGTLTYDVNNEEITWNISDSLGISPHDMAIHGPLQHENDPYAPVFVKLGVQRDERLRLAGSATVNRDKLIQMKQEPSKFYIAVQERYAHNKVRELARDKLDKKCQKGVE